MEDLAEILFCAIGDARPMPKDVQDIIADGNRHYVSMQISRAGYYIAANEIPESWGITHESLPNKLDALVADYIEYRKDKGAGII